MGIFRSLTGAAPGDQARRLEDEALYAAVLHEIELGTRRDGLWAQALERAKMNESEAKAIYIGLRVQSLRDELALRGELARRALPEKPTEGVVSVGRRERLFKSTGPFTAEAYQCVNCDYNGKLLIQKRGLFGKTTYKCPACTNVVD